MIRSAPRYCTGSLTIDRPQARQIQLTEYRALRYFGTLTLLPPISRLPLRPTAPIGLPSDPTVDQ